MTMVLAKARVVIEGDTVHVNNAFAAAEHAMVAAGERMGRIGRELTHKLTLPILGVAAAGVHMAAGFDESMRKIVALTDNSAEQVAAWSDRVREMGTALGVGPREAADALFFITGAGLKGEQAMEALEASMKGSVIGLGEVQVVADAATSAMNAYSKSGMTATRATEILAGAVKFGKMEAASLAPELGSLTGISSALGISFEEVAGVLAVFSRTGTSAAEGATQLSGIMNTLLGSSKEGEDLLAGAGLSLEKLRDIAAGPGGLIAVMRILDKTFGKNQEALRAVIPNLRAFRGVMTALAQDGDIVDEIMRGTANSIGILEAGLKASEGPAHKLKVAWAQLKNAAVDIGGVLIPVLVPALTSLAGVVKDAVKWFGEMNSAGQSITLAFLAWAAAIGPLLSGIGSLIKLVGELRAVMASTALFAGGALLPLTLIGAGVAGIVAITAAWLDMRSAVKATERAIEDANDKMLEIWRSSDPTGARQRQEAFDALIADKQARLNEIQRQLLSIPEETARAGPPGITTQNAGRFGDLGFAAGEAGDTLGTATQALTGELTPALRANREELQADALQLNETIMRYTEARDAFKEVADALDASKRKGGADTVIVPPAAAGQAEAIDDAMKELAASIKAAWLQEQLYGDQFDMTAAKAAALQSAVQALTTAGVDLDMKLDAHGTTIRILAQEYRLLDASVQAAAAEEAAWQETLAIANAAVVAAVTPLQTYTRTIAALMQALASGDIGMVEFAAGVAAATRAFREGQTEVANLDAAIEQTAQTGMDAMSDFAAGSATAFRDFVDSALRDLSRLAFQIAMINILKGAGISLPGFAGGAATGGFFPSNTFGLVGERGPELVMAGRRGLTVTPMPAARAAGREAGDGGGFGGMVPVTINVNAVDARGVAQFFEENQPMIAGVMMRAQQQSATLRRRLGG